MAKYLFDTCSLIALVRYYIPFDSQGKLGDFIHKGFETKEFIMLEQVKNECKQVSKGLVFQKLPQLKDIKSINFNEVITDKIHRLIDNNFIVSKFQKDRLESVEYESHKNRFINGTDFNLIYCAMKNHYTIITEETTTINDNKLFKKISLLCEAQGIECMSISKLLQSRLDIDFVIKSTMENVGSL